MRATLLLVMALAACNGPPGNPEPENPWQRHFHPELSWGDRMIIDNCRRCPGCCADLDDVETYDHEERREHCRHEAKRNGWTKQQLKRCEVSDGRAN